MARKRYNAEEIIHRLREADVLFGQGETVGQVCKQLGVVEQTYYRWRKAYGGMKIDQAPQLGDAVFTAQAVQHNTDLLLRTVLLTRLTFDVLNDVL